MAEILRACPNCGNLFAMSSPCPHCARTKGQAASVSVPLGGPPHKAARHGFVLTLDVPIEAAHEISMAAILKDNYLIVLNQRNLIRCKENRPLTAMSLTAAVTLDVHLRSFATLNTSEVVIDVGYGSARLFGAIVATNRPHMERLKSMIESCYREHVRTTSAGIMDIASQISRLAELHASGQLTTDEFTLAKAKLLSS